MSRTRVRHLVHALKKEVIYVRHLRQVLNTDVVAMNGTADAAYKVAADRSLGTAELALEEAATWLADVGRKR